MASNKKWIVAGSITLLIVFGVSMGTGAIIGATTKDDPSYINVSIGNNIISLDNELELGSKDSTDAEKAANLEEFFYKKSVEELAKGNEEWAVPHLSAPLNQEELTNSFVKVKFINDTQTSSVYDYLNSMIETSSHQGELIKLIAELKSTVESNAAATYNWIEITGLQLLQDPAYSTLVNDIYTTLSDDVSYLKEVYKEMYSYFYLWQEPVQSNTYDTILTRELVYSSPSLVSEMDMDASELWALGIAGDPKYGELSDVKSDKPTITAEKWNETFEYLLNENVISDKTTQDDQLLLGATEGFKGFKGIKFGTSAGSLVGDDWTDWDKTWDTTIDGETSTQTKNSFYTNEDILTNANFYVSSDKFAPGEGAIIKADSDSSGGEESPDEGTAYTYAYTQLYPFKFIENGKNTYSLFANGNSTAYTTADDAANAENFIFDVWFGEDYSLAGEIYVVESLLKHKSTLVNSSMNYWKDHGFYIELSGSYEEDLASFLPTEILLDN